MRETWVDVRLFEEEEDKKPDSGGTDRGVESSICFLWWTAVQIQLGEHRGCVEKQRGRSHAGNVCAHGDRASLNHLPG